MVRIALTIAGLATQVFVVGEGPGIVLLHGSADTPFSWEAVALHLSERFRVWAPVLPSPVGARALETDLPWLDALLIHAGAQVLAGHSYGALLALRWALMHPARIERLVLAEPIAWGIARDDPAFEARFADLEKHGIARFVAGEVEPALSWLVDYWNGAGFWARLPDKVRAGLLAGAARTSAEVVSSGDDRTSPAELAELRVPTRMLAGAASTAESLTVSRRIAAALPNATLTVLSGAGHQFLRSHAEAVAAACIG